MSNKKTKIYTNKHIKLINDFTRKIYDYASRYENQNCIYIKVIYLCISKILSFKNLFNCKKIKTDKQTIHVAFYMQGGVGDIIVYLKYIEKFAKMFDCKFSIDLYPTLKKVVYEKLLYKYSFINNVYNGLADYQNYYLNYDIAINMQRITKIDNFNDEKVKKLSPKCAEVVEKMINFEKQFPFVYKNMWQANYISKDIGMALNKNRCLLPDISSSLGLTEEDKTLLALLPQSFDILNRYNLKDIKYITIHRGIDNQVKSNDSVRLWPIEYYNDLVKRIKENYPSLKIIQLGYSKEWDLPIENVDVDLRGETTFDEVMSILKYSSLHIDYEGGYVHINNLLSNKSVVIFGQTEIKDVGYEGNINLKSNVCPVSCEGLSDKWAFQCIRGFDNPPPCMTELKPDYVFNQIKPYLDTKMSEPQKVVNRLSTADVNEYFSNNHIENAKILFFGKEFLDVAKTLNNNSINIYDYDLENNQIKDAENSGITLNYGDIYNLPENSESFDIVVSKDFSVYENPEFVQRELSRVLKNEKTLLIKE